MSCDENVRNEDRVQLKSGLYVSVKRYHKLAVMGEKKNHDNYLQPVGQFAEEQKGDRHHFANL